MNSRLKELSIEFYLILFIIFLSMAATYAFMCILHSYTIDMANTDRIAINSNLLIIDTNIKKLESEIKNIQIKILDTQLRINNDHDKSK